jgi:hypothetical protein
MGSTQLYSLLKTHFLADRVAQRLKPALILLLLRHR